MRTSWNDNDIYENRRATNNDIAAGAKMLIVYAIGAILCFLGIFAIGWIAR